LFHGNTVANLDKIHVIHTDTGDDDLHDFTKISRWCKVCVQQVGEGHAGPTPLGPSLRNSFVGKATATIYRRAQSLWGFFSWIRIDKNRDLVLPFPSTKNGIKMSFFWMLHPQIFRQPQVDRG